MNDVTVEWGAFVLETPMDWNDTAFDAGRPVHASRRARTQKPSLREAPTPPSSPPVDPTPLAAMWRGRPNGTWERLGNEAERWWLSKHPRCDPLPPLDKYDFTMDLPDGTVNGDVKWTPDLDSKGRPSRHLYVDADDWHETDWVSPRADLYVLVMGGKDGAPFTFRGWAWWNDFNVWVPKQSRGYPGWKTPLITLRTPASFRQMYDTVRQR